MNFYVTSIAIACVPQFVFTFVFASDCFNFFFHLLASLTLSLFHLNLMCARELHCETVSCARRPSEKKKSLSYSWPVYRVLYLNRTRNILQTITVTNHIQREAQIDDTATEIHTFIEIHSTQHTCTQIHRIYLLRSAENYNLLRYLIFRFYHFCAWRSLQFRFHSSFSSPSSANDIITTQAIFD